MSSESLKNFERNDKRLEDLLSFYEYGTGKKQGRPTRDCSELGRAAIAQAVSCMDAYLHDVLAERLERAIGSATWTDALKEQAEAVADGELVLSLAKSSTSKADLAKAIGGRFETLPLQKQGRVEEVLQILGVPDPWARIEHHFRKTPKGVKTKEQMKSRLNGIVERRHQIVHRADVPKAATTAKKFRKTEATKARLFLQDFVEAIDKAVMEV